MKDFYNDIVELANNKYKADNRDYLKLLAAGNAAQMEKLKENGHKRGFEEADVYYASGRLKDELTELLQELYDDKKGWLKKEQYDIINTRKEFADIANFAHMGILACDNEMKKTF